MDKDEIIVKSVMTFAIINLVISLILATVINPSFLCGLIFSIAAIFITLIWISQEVNKIMILSRNPQP